MSRKVLCPAHDDHEPSMHVYEKFAFCFVCKASIPVSELNIPENKHIPKAEPTNIADRVKYIKTLDTKIIRGLQLPYDNSGFYILWPGDKYYKRRNFHGSTRYIGPSGVRAPLYVCPGTASHLVMVEGEMNCISMHSIGFGEYKFVSPGSAAEAMRHIKYYLGYSKITLVFDHDSSGVVFGSQLKDHLLKAGKNVTLVLMEKDANALLQVNEDKLKEFMERNL